MVLPIYKVVSLVIRVASKPLIAYTKQVHLKNGGVEHPTVRKSFVWLGNSYNRWQTFINRKFMKIQSQFAYKPLNDELAIEKGIQFFYEILFYSIVIGFPLYEMWRANVEGKQKSQKLQQRLKSIEKKLTDMSENSAKPVNQQQKQIKQVKQIKQAQQIGVNTTPIDTVSPPIQKNSNFIGLKPIQIVYLNGETKKYLL